MTTEQSRQFIEQQIAGCDPTIKQLQIMQIAWQAGGEIFKEKLDTVTKELGSWLSIKKSLEDQLNELLTAVELDKK